MSDKVVNETEKPGAGTVFKLVMIGLAGGIVGAFPYAVLLCALDISSIAMMVLCGIGAVVFYLALGHGPMKCPHPYIILAADTVLAAAITNTVTNMIHYVPKVEIAGSKMNYFEKLKYFYSFSFSHPDKITSQGFEVYEDAFAVPTVLTASIIFALIGAVAAFVGLKIYEYRKAKKSRA